MTVIGRGHILDIWTVDHFNHKVCSPTHWCGPCLTNSTYNSKMLQMEMFYVDDCAVKRSCCEIFNASKIQNCLTALSTVGHVSTQRVAPSLQTLTSLFLMLNKLLYCSGRPWKALNRTLALQLLWGGRSRASLGLQYGCVLVQFDTTHLIDLSQVIDTPHIHFTC